MSGLNPDGLGVNRTYGNVESDSVNTENAFNSDIGDGVNYIDPLWLARTNHRVLQIPFGTFNGMGGPYTSGSASSGTGAQGSQSTIQTGATSESTILVERRAGTGSGNDFNGYSWGDEITFRADINISAADGKASIGIGRGTTDLTGGYPRVDIRSDGDTLQGYVSDGSSESVITLESGHESSPRTVWIDVMPDEGVVKFYLDDRTSAEGEISDNLPSGKFPSRVFAANAANLSNTTNKRLGYSQPIIVGR